MKMTDLLKVIFIVQAFYGLAITLVAYAIPPEALGYTQSVSGPANQYNLEHTSSLVNSQLNQQKNTPLVDLGALLFYSGNMFIDLLLNFITAIPQMIMLMVYIIFGQIISIDATIMAMIGIFITGVCSILYLIDAITLILNIRSRGGVI